MKSKSFFFVLASLILVLTGCNDKDLLTEPESVSVIKSSAIKIKIAVLSDIHYMDRTLIPEDISANPAFQAVLIADGYKLTEISDPIFRKAISELKKEKPDIVLIPGDMSKDGEKLNHEAVREQLQQLIVRGIKVFVVPGNNDINNPSSTSYEGTTAVSIPNVNPEEFVEIYYDCGYNGSERDPNSLSYLSKPYPKLWILGIDDCRYSPKVSRKGEIKPQTLAWIKEKMVEANENDALVLTIMHHGVIEHFSNNISINPGTVLENWEASSQDFMKAGIRFVFTGHNHGNDITELIQNGETLTDIETGALTTPISPYRIVILDDNYLKIETRYIRKIDYPLPDNMVFAQYCEQVISERLDLFYSKYVLPSMFKTPTDVAEVVAPFVTRATMAQYAGDENINPVEIQNIAKLKETIPPEYASLIGAINSFWTDLPPNDNKIHIKIK